MEQRCPECNSLMYERKVKKGPKAGESGHGCPLCFFRLPEDTPSMSDVDIVNIIFAKHYYNKLKKKKDDFKFWSDEDDDNKSESE